MKTSLYLLALIMLLAAPAHAEVTYTLDEDYGNVPVTFVPNVGQFDEGIVFAAEGNNGGVFNDDEGLIFELAPETVKLWPPDAAYDYKTYLQFRDANANPEVTFEDQAPWNNNYFIGNDKSQWHTDVPNYRTVRFSEIYPGVDLCMTGEGRVIVSSIIVEPHGDPSQIYFPGGGSRTVDEDGNLCVEFYRDPEIASSRYYVYEPPECVQYIDGEERVISLKYQYVEAPVNDFLTFDIGEYDPAHELIIKPGPVYSPLMWVKSTTEVNDIAIDDEDCVYVAGGAEYIFPTTGNTVFETLFAMKLNEAGDELGYVTYFGIDGGIQYVTDIEVDSQKNLVLTGYFSENFIYTENAFDKEINGTSDSYVLKLAENGNDLVFSTYIGGNNTEGGLGLTLDEQDYIYINGSTTSTDFPTTPNVYSPEFGSEKNCFFISKIRPDGSALEYSTFITNAGISGIIVDQSGSIYMTGRTSSSAFETANIITELSTNDVFKTDEIFVAKLNENGSAMDFVTIIVGDGFDAGIDIVIDDNQNIYICGRTQSVLFPTTENAFQRTSNNTNNYYDTVVFKLDSNGENLLYSSYLSGEEDDICVDICLLNDGKVVVSGDTFSSDFPQTDPNPLIFNWEVFFTIIDTFTGNLEYSCIYSNGNNSRTTTNSQGDIFNVGYTGGSNLLANTLFDYNTTSIGTAGYIFKLINNSPTAVQDIEKNPVTYQLSAYPNPFNATTTIQYKIQENSHVTLSVYNALGQKITTLYSKHQRKGSYKYVWDANEYASGLYYCVIETEYNRQIMKLTLLK